MVIDGLKSGSESWNSINWSKVARVVHRLQVRIVKAEGYCWVFNDALSMLEPCEAKVSRRVLRGPGASNGPRLLDTVPHSGIYERIYQPCNLETLLLGQVSSTLSRCRELG